MICTNGIENLEQVFENVNLNDEPVVNFEDEDVSEDILKESKLSFVMDRLVEIFNRFKEQIELRMALVMSQTHAIAIE